MNQGYATSWTWAKFDAWEYLGLQKDTMNRTIKLGIYAYVEGSCLELQKPCDEIASGTRSPVLRLGTGDQGRSNHS